MKLKGRGVGIMNEKMICKHCNGLGSIEEPNSDYDSWQCPYCKGEGVEKLK